MYKFVKESVTCCLRHDIGKCALNLFVARMMKLCFFLYIVSVLYLFVYDTSFIAELGLYKNKYIAATVCAFIVFIGFALFFVSKWLDFSWKHYTVSKMQYCEKVSPTIKFISKLIALQIAVFTLKLLTMLFSLLPSAVLGVTLFIMLKNGVSKLIALVCIFGFIMSFIAGLLTGVILCNRFYLAEYCSYTDRNKSVINAIKYSIYLMDFKCLKLFKFKICNVILKIVGLVIPRFRVIANAREFFYITDKTTEYAQKLHTPKKTVVFYF